MGTKGEKREAIKRNQSKMIVRGRSLLTILRIKAVKAEKANEKLKQLKTHKKGK